jgi:hypothetical protein
LIWLRDRHIGQVQDIDPAVLVKPYCFHSSFLSADLQIQIPPNTSLLYQFKTCPLGKPDKLVG